MMMIPCQARLVSRIANSSSRGAAVCGTFRWLSESTAAAASPESSPPAARNGPPPIVWTTHRLSADQIAKIDGIFHKILWLDMIETSMLTTEMNRRLGVVLTPKQQTAVGRQLERRHADGSSSDTPAGVATEEAAPVAKLVDLKLTGFDDSAKIKVIKEVRSIAGLGLKEAKELVEGYPKTIQKGLKPEVAEELKAKLEAVGAKVEVA